MVRVSYKHIIRIIDLIDEKILQLQSDKANENKRANFIPYSVKDNIMSETIAEVEDERISRFDNIISDFQAIKDILNSELDRIEFKLGIEEKQWNQNQPHQSQPNQSK